ncbi:MAG TPA: PIN domain-containing protein, partial [Bacteroidales bacterium]|nr:PIN domain-containing protein [Bacteroidales bacterium]
MAKTTQKQKKIFVLDTSVILYNHSAIYSFEDNDVAMPISVLEELDTFKKGNDTKNYEAREFIRILDKMSDNQPIKDWIKIERAKGMFTVIMDETSNPDATKLYHSDKVDHRIINVAIKLSQKYKDRKVILVSKDINLRLKAKALNIIAEDFETGKVKDVEGLYTGMTLVEGLTKDIIDSIYQNGFCLPGDVGIKKPIPNHYFILRNTSNSVLAYYNPLTGNIEKLEKKPAYRIMPRNAEQVFALHAITAPEIKLVTLQGVAGTGKTLLALAGAL